MSRNPSNVLAKFIAEKLVLGIVYNKNHLNVYNHRPLLSVVMNPFLRFIGMEFVTIVSNVHDINKFKIHYMELRRCPPEQNIKSFFTLRKAEFYYKLDEADLAVKYERIWC